MGDEQSSMDLFKTYLKDKGDGLMEFWLVLFTIGLVLTKYIILDGSKLLNKVTLLLTKKKGIFINILYFLALIMTAGFVNYYKYLDNCPNSELNSDSAYFLFMMTFFPWISIMGLCYGLLIALPGWKAPFSNTFGYFITMYMLGGQTKFNEIIDTENKNNTSEILKNNFTNLINDYTPENVNKLKDIAGSGQLSTKPYQENASKYNYIATLIMLKDYISEGIWFVLMGLLVINVTNNYISQSACV